MEIITMAMSKGGTGKTTTTAVLAQAGAFKGKRVLAIDLDTQADLSFCLGADLSLKGAFEFINGDPAKNCIQTTASGIDLLCASDELSLLKTEKGSARRLKEALDSLEGYEQVFIDIPPTSTEIQYNAFMASTGVVIPLQADGFNAKNLDKTIEAIEQFKESNNKLSIKGIVFTANSDRSTIAGQFKDLIISEAAKRYVNYLGDIRKCVAIKEAQALQKSIFDYAPKSNACEDYLHLYTRIFGL